MAQPPGTKDLMASGYSSLAHMESARDAGAWGFVAKSLTASLPSWPRCVRSWTAARGRSGSRSDIRGKGGADP
jgi:hypothetical protein